MGDFVRKSFARLRFELATKSSHDFQGLFSLLLTELMEGTSQTKRLGHYDQTGVDAIVIASNSSEIEVAIQCKGFEVIEYGADQHRQCRDEIKKYAGKGPNAAEYWLVINRSIKDRAMRAELESDLASLVQTEKVGKAELLDLERMVHRLRRVAAKRLSIWAEAKRDELFEYYQSRMQFVQYIPDVPYNGAPARTGPVPFILKQIQRFFDGLPEHQAGKSRRPPNFLITSEFGFGKTSTLQALATSWIPLNGHLLYVPAALLNNNAFGTSSDLADSLLSFLIPDDTDISDLGFHVFRDALRDAMAKSKNWLLLIDGLDENAAAFSASGLSALWKSIKGLGIPAILSARDELVETRNAEFFPDPGLNSGPTFKRIRLNDWPDTLIVEFVQRFAAARSGSEPPGFLAFRRLIESGRYGEVFGDIPKRPLFLGMLTEDAWSGNEPARQLHRLYGQYFRKKFHLDRHSMAASGADNRPSAIVDAFGQEEAAERLILVMQDAAGTMLQITESPDGRSAVHRDTISEKELKIIAARYDVPFLQIEDMAMHSLLQPGGRDPATRQRLMRFAHRSFQDWFLARHFAADGREIYKGLPPTVVRFLHAMRDDIAAGGTLP